MAWAASQLHPNAPLRLQEHMLVVINQERENAKYIIKQSIRQLWLEAAAITGMTYVIEGSSQSATCLTPEHITKSWRTDGTAMNIKRLAWILYHYGQDLCVCARGVPYEVLVEQKVLKGCNALYESKEDPDWRTKPCVQQYYNCIYNGWRSNILRQGNSKRHSILLTIEKPKSGGEWGKHYKRKKTAYFVCGQNGKWSMVS
jgi:hypothetical protein